jgi:hypothetical protein
MRVKILIALGAIFGLLQAAPLSAQPDAPASYPHDMRDFGCTHRDGDICDNTTFPPPDYNPLVGTWVRISILRNGFSVQPPEAPLYVQFMQDGWWSMMEFAAGRPKINKPLDQQTPQELFSRFDRLAGSWGPYTTIGQVNYRHHKVNLTPGGGTSQERAWRFVGNALILEGAGPNNSPIVHFMKLPRQPLGTTALVGSWQRTAYSGEGGNAVPEHLMLGGDGWYQATVTPANRKGAPGVTLDKYTTEQFLAAYGGMGASRGTYNATATTLTRRHIADVDPNLEDKLTTGTYTLTGDSFTWKGTDAAGKPFSATYTRLKPFDIYAPLPKPGTW